MPGSGPSTAPRAARWVPVAASIFLLTAVSPRLQGQAPPTRVPFTPAQAAEGGRVYTQKCAACHGARLDDGAAPPLVGQRFLDTWTAPARTLDDLFFIIQSTMPKNEGGTLTPAQYVAVLANILERNGYAATDRELTADRSALAALRLTRPAAQTAEKKGPPPDFIAGEGGTAPKATGPNQQDLLAAASSRDWLMHTHDYSGTRFSPLAQITAANVSQLKATCLYQVGETGNFQTGPVVDRGTMYITTPAATIALDATTCRLKWRYVWTPRAMELFGNNRGVAVKDGRVVRATMDGYVIALDREDGRLLWARHLADTTKGETFTMAPLLYDDLLVIGPAVSEYAIKGWVGAFKLDDGAPVWRFNIVPAPGEPGSETWKQPDGFPVGGGGVWTTPTLDPEREIIYVATGNPAPDLPAALRGGTNLYTNSVVALNVRTGKLTWYEQVVPADNHDWDLTHASPLYKTTVNGRERKMLSTVGKDGILRVFDRDSHSSVFDTPVTTIENAEARVTPAGTRACPGLVGGVEWNGPTYHPGLNVIAIGAVDWCATFYMDPEPRYVPGQIFMGGRTVNDKQSQGWITAVDATTGKVRWKYRSPRPIIGAVTSTAGGLILTGELTGDLVAFDANTGDVKYRFNTGGPIGAGIITYEVDARQYIAVASGRPSRMWTEQNTGNPLVMVFALDR
ncbi:MAG TPA: PQQ-binding-like beta-propeller repeat protein [Vicinamibacterales bacterium]